MVEPSKPEAPGLSTGGPHDERAN